MPALKAAVERVVALDALTDEGSAAQVIESKRGRRKRARARRARERERESESESESASASERNSAIARRVRSREI
jgi:hypothetical protein